MLGGEYFFIAEALAEGKGFSNPFQIDTGPTAWMPPLYSFFLAILIKILALKRAVAVFVILLKNITLVLTGLMVYDIARKTSTRIKPECILFIYITFLLLYFRWYFQFSHDEWFLLALVCISLAFITYINKYQLTNRNAFFWGIIGSLNLLASPALGLAWIVLTLLFYIRSQHKRLKALLLSFIVCSVLFMPWMIRNYIVFNKIIPIKSNFFWDAYCINYNTKDGINTEDFLIKNHPYFTVRLHSDPVYKNIGEIAFMEIYKGNFFNKVRTEPYRFINNIKNRVLAVFLVYYPYHRYEVKAWWKNIIHALPFLSIIIIIYYKYYKLDIKLYFMNYIAFYFVYLIPYIIISYYMRYDIPLTPIKILFVFWAFDALFANAVNTYSKAGKIFIY